RDREQLAIRAKRAPQRNEPSHEQTALERRGIVNDDTSIGAGRGQIPAIGAEDDLGHLVGRRQDGRLELLARHVPYQDAVPTLLITTGCQQIRMGTERQAYQSLSLTPSERCFANPIRKVPDRYGRTIGRTGTELFSIGSDSERGNRTRRWICGQGSVSGPLVACRSLP